MGGGVFPPQISLSKDSLADVHKDLTPGKLLIFWSWQSILTTTYAIELLVRMEGGINDNFLRPVADAILR